MPRDSRVYRAEDKSFAWSDAEYLLARIEYNIRALAYALGHEKGTPEPKPIRTPADSERLSHELKKTDKNKIAEMLGIPPERR